MRRGAASEERSRVEGAPMAKGAEAVVVSWWCGSRWWPTDRDTGWMGWGRRPAPGEAANGEAGRQDALMRLACSASAHMLPAWRPWHAGDAGVRAAAVSLRSSGSLAVPLIGAGEVGMSRVPPWLY